MDQTIEIIVRHQNRNSTMISPELHSHFIEFLGTCNYEGIWVGEDSEVPNIGGFRREIIEGFKQLEPPVIRWPGGCYADTYHWRDGIGNRTDRPVTYNENFGTYERDTNQFGTDEFLRFCKIVGAKPWININMLSGSIAEMREWMEYCNREENTSISAERVRNTSQQIVPVEYWGLGNEVWGGGGMMTAQGYAQEYRKFATAMPSFSGIDKAEYTKMKRIASGPDGNKPKERVRWTIDFFNELAQYRMPPIDGYDLHFYNWNMKQISQNEVEFDRIEWDEVIQSSFELEEVIQEQRALIEQGLAQIPEPEGFFPAPPKQCALIVGEWGNWHASAFRNRPALFQQCTMRDAVTTALTLDIFHRNADKVQMACVAQSVNVLNSLFLTDKENCIRTPNFDVFDMYKVHKGACLAEIRGEKSKNLYSMASTNGEYLNVNLVNASYDKQTNLFIRLPKEWRFQHIKCLSSDRPNACNTFSDPDRVRMKDGLAPIEREPGLFYFEIPAASVNVCQFALSM